MQCRTPSRSDRFKGVTGVARGPKGRNRNLPWPPGKKVIKMLIFYLFVLLPQSRLRLDSSLDREPFWRYLSSYVKPPSLREVDFAKQKTEGVHRSCCCLRRPLSLTSFDSSPAGEPFGHIIFYSPALGSSSLGPLPR